MNFLFLFLNETKENCYSLHETDLETGLAYLIFKTISVV